MTRSVERLLWLAAVALALTAGVRVTTGLEPGERTPTVVAPVRWMAHPTPGRPDSALAYLTAQNPFRLDRLPSRVPYGTAPTPSEPPPSAPPPEPRPELDLKGIIGPPWQAILGNIPGRGPTVVRPGERYGSLLVAAVGPDSVIVEGVDTTWVLRFGRR